MTKYIFSLIFGLVGLGVLYLCFYLYNDNRVFLATAKETDGEVVELISKRDSDGTTYRPRVRYRPQGGYDMFFESSVSSNPPAFDVGEKVKVLYEPGNPQSAKINSFMSLWFGVLISGVLGLIFSAVGLGTLVHAIRKHKMYGWLEKYGQTITVKVNETYQRVADKKTRNTNGRTVYVKSGGDDFWKINAQWQNPRDQKIYVFESEPIAFDPAEYVRETVNVRIDPNNPKRYRMDISFLPQRA